MKPWHHYALMFLAGMSGVLVAEVLARATWVDDLLVKVMSTHSERIERLEDRTSRYDERIDSLELKVGRLSGVRD